MSAVQLPEDPAVWLTTVESAKTAPGRRAPRGKGTPIAYLAKTRMVPRRRPVRAKAIMEPLTASQDSCIIQCPTYVANNPMIYQQLAIRSSRQKSLEGRPQIQLVRRETAGSGVRTAAIDPHLAWNWTRATVCVL